MEDMTAQTAYFAVGPDYNANYYTNTPSPQQSILSSNTYGSQQLTPQTDHSEYGFPDASLSRSNSEPFLFAPHIVPSIAPAVGGPQRIVIPHYRGDDKPKNKRTQCACENCRNKKSKCDGGSPCQGCKEANLDCKYREIPPSKKDNAMSEILELMQAQSKDLKRLVNRIDEIDSRLRRVEQRTDQQRSCWSCGSAPQYAMFQ